MPPGNRPRGIGAPRRGRLRDRACMLALALDAEPCDCPMRIEEGLPLSGELGAEAVQGCTWHEFRSALGEGTEAQRAYWNREREDCAAKLPEMPDDARPQLRPLDLPPRQRLLAAVFGSSACIHTYRPHVLPLEDWLAVLRLWDAQGYADRPLGRPRMVATRAGRVALYRLRAGRGESLFHPQDLDLSKEDGIEVLAQKGKAERDKGAVER